MLEVGKQSAMRQTLSWEPDTLDQPLWRWPWGRHLGKKTMRVQHSQQRFNEQQAASDERIASAKEFDRDGTPSLQDQVGFGEGVSEVLTRC
jgi:hypothetical protein